jgi:hypothetical protein
MYKVTYRTDDNPQGGMVDTKTFSSLSEAMEFTKSIAGRMLELKRVEGEE